ncbi:putative dehydrogenase [Saonia flava]|uniref:Putative dehydrogenase n=1 Tax=Saonia flava TaxID=523696 RepID=A0A846QY15_9FLAO|nr:Gfo/Idh/MocA family oxidoreductase [Saonia flava]NJB69994.1 putative dehydrogenase [Saonia flava]
METKNRRNFIKKSVLGATALALPLEMFPATVLGANDRINLGVIGCNGMGWSNTLSILKVKGVKLVALCDVDQNVLDRRVKEMKDASPDKASKKIKVYSDYRALLDNKDIDVVIIGTPDHWHCKIMVDACEAGKQVYVEKPIANTIEECNIMLRAAKKYNTVVQVGQWQRSGPHYREAIDIVQSGVLGKIRVVKVWAYQGWMKPVPVVPDSKAPKGVDYKQWLGPATNRPFNANRFHFNFRWFWDYAGGLMTDWGVHEIDIALYAMKALAPKSIMASGGKLAYPDDASETPDTLQALFEYENFNMLWEHATGIDLGPYQKPEGIAFIGNNATLVLNRGGFEVLLEKKSEGYGKSSQNKIDPIASGGVPEGVNYLDLHQENFIKAVRANDSSLLNTPIESGSVAAINAQMGNIAYKTGEKLYWDAKQGNFGNNEKANKLIKAQYHNGWEKPLV